MSIKKADTAGFNLLEMMFAMAIMAIALSGVIKAIMISNQSQRAAMEASVAQNIAREVVENFQIEDFQVLKAAASQPIPEMTDKNLKYSYSVVYPANGNTHEALVQVWVVHSEGSIDREIYRLATIIAEREYE